MSKRSVPTLAEAGIGTAPRRRISKSWGLLPLAAVAVVALAACNSSDAGSGATTAQAPAGGNSGQITEGSAAQGAGQGNGAGQGQNAGGQRRPGTSGLIAEVDEDSMQVQSSDSQTTVTWTGKTTFAQNVKGSLSDVTEGSCIVAVAPTSSGSGSAGSTAAPSASTDTNEPVTAGTVAITAAVDGQCTAGFGGLGGFGGGNRANGGAMPSGAMPTGQLPSGAAPTGEMGAPPSGMPGQNGGTGTGDGRGGLNFGGIVTGKVTSVSGSTITVESTTFAGAAAPGAGGQSTAAPSAAPSAEKTTRTVEVTSSTTYTTEKKATPSAVKTGLCATARGTADDTGAVAATSITLSTAVDGSCTTGFGGFGNRGGARNGQSAPTTSETTHG